MSTKSKYMNVHDQVQFGRLGIAKIVLAKYTGNAKEYAFFCADPRVEAGDLMVARSKIGFEVVYITSIIDEKHPKAQYANNWVIGKVEDMMDLFVKQHEKMSALMTIRKTLAEKIEKARLHAGGFFLASEDFPLFDGNFYHLDRKTGEKTTLTREGLRQLREALGRVTPPITESIFPQILAGMGTNRIIHDCIEFFPDGYPENLTNATRAASMGNFTIYHDDGE